ncbi:MAG: GHKL domain-containing protein [Lachnoclostridium sp.]
MGIGTQSVRTIVHNYDGQIKYDITDNSILISIILPGERKN